MAGRRCTSPRTVAALRALRCWWSAAPTWRQRTTRCAPRSHCSTHGATGGAFGSSVCSLHAAHPPAQPCACALPHAGTVASRQQRGARTGAVPLAPAVAMQRCADAAAASLSAAALHRCGCAQGGTPLHCAALHDGQVACVAVLVERGANKEAKNEVRCAVPFSRRCTTYSAHLPATAIAAPALAVMQSVYTLAPRPRCAARADLPGAARQLRESPRRAASLLVVRRAALAMRAMPVPDPSFLPPCSRSSRCLLCECALAAAACRFRPPLMLQCARSAR
jgi:hypothetical protein